MIGFVTGRDAMKTYHIVSNQADTEEILRENNVAYIRKRTDEGNHFVMDIENSSTKSVALRDQGIELNEINQIPEMFKSLLLTDKDVS